MRTEASTRDLEPSRKQSAKALGADTEDNAVRADTRQKTKIKSTEIKINKALS